MGNHNEAPGGINPSNPRCTNGSADSSYIELPAIGTPAIGCGTHPSSSISGSDSDEDSLILDSNQHRDPGLPAVDPAAGREYQGNRDHRNDPISGGNMNLNVMLMNSNSAYAPGGGSVAGTPATDCYSEFPPPLLTPADSAYRSILSVPPSCSTNGELSPEPSPTDSNGHQVTVPTARATVAGPVVGHGSSSSADSAGYTRGAVSSNAATLPHFSRPDADCDAAGGGGGGLHNVPSASSSASGGGGGLKNDASASSSASSSHGQGQQGKFLIAKPPPKGRDKEKRPGSHAIPPLAARADELSLVSPYAVSYQSKLAHGGAKSRVNGRLKRGFPGRNKKKDVDNQLGGIVPEENPDDAGGAGGGSSGTGHTTSGGILHRLSKVFSSSSASAKDSDNGPTPKTLTSAAAAFLESKTSSKSRSQSHCQSGRSKSQSQGQSQAVTPTEPSKNPSPLTEEPTTTAGGGGSGLPDSAFTPIEPISSEPGKSVSPTQPHPPLEPKPPSKLNPRPPDHRKSANPGFRRYELRYMGALLRKPKDSKDPKNPKDASERGAASISPHPNQLPTPPPSQIPGPIAPPGKPASGRGQNNGVGTEEPNAVLSSKGVNGMGSEDPNAALCSKVVNLEDHAGFRSAAEAACEEASTLSKADREVLAKTTSEESGGGASIGRGPKHLPARPSCTPR